MLFKTYIYWLSVFTLVVGLALSCPVCKACFPVTHPMDVVGLYRKQLHTYSLFRMFQDVCGIISCGLYTSVLLCSLVFCGVLRCPAVFWGFQAYPYGRFVSMHFRSLERNDHTVNVCSRERTCGRFVPRNETAYLISCIRANRMPKKSDYM